MRALVLVAALGSTAHARSPSKPHRHPTVDICAVDLGAIATTTPTLADLPAERGVAPEVRSAFQLLDVAKRTANEATLAAIFPAPWHATVALDATGMAHVVAFELPGTHTADELAAPILAFVRAHPCLFGAHDPGGLTIHISAGDVIVDHAPHTIGALAAHITAKPNTTAVRITGHLWPIPDRALAINKHYLRRYLARTFEQITNGHVRHAKTFDRDFHSDNGPVLSCRDSVLQLTDALFIELAGTPNGDPVLAELPAAIDPVTGKPIETGWIAPVLATADATAPAADRMNDAGRLCLAL